MSNNSHFLAVDATALTAELQHGDFDLEDLFSSSGLSWCGVTFETGYVFREHLETFIEPRLSAPVRALIDGNADPRVSHAALVAFAEAEEYGMEITPLSPGEFDELRDAVGRAVVEADWGPHDNQDWAVLAADRTSGDFYLLVEFV